jgi:hypothetical protein
VAGAYTTLIPIKPADADEKRKMEAGRPYTAEAKEVHWACWEKLEAAPGGRCDG